jgi:hypothetical protein
MRQTMQTFETLVVERRKMDSKVFGEPQQRVGRLAHIRQKRATNRCACLWSLAMGLLHLGKPNWPAQTFPHSNAPWHVLVHPLERVRRSSVTYKASVITI